MIQYIHTKTGRLTAGFILATIIIMTVGTVIHPREQLNNKGKGMLAIENDESSENDSAKLVKSIDDTIEIKSEETEQIANNQTVVAPDSTQSRTNSAASDTAKTQEQARNQIQQRNADIYLLARVIHAEARGEPFVGKVAVGAVLLNRLESSRFPNTLAGIIFKPGEFCTVRDGQIWMTPNADAIRAAEYAMAGWDPSGGALYFYNPAKTTSRWIWSRTVTYRVGEHVFAV